MPPRAAAAHGAWGLMAYISRPRPEAEVATEDADVAMKDPEAADATDAAEASPTEEAADAEAQPEAALEPTAEEAPTADEAPQENEQKRRRAKRLVQMDLFGQPVSERLVREQLEALSAEHPSMELLVATGSVSVDHEIEGPPPETDEKEGEQIQQEAAKEQLEAGVVEQPARGATWSYGFH